MKKAKQCKDISDRMILCFLCGLNCWATWGDGYSMPSVQTAMPGGTPKKLQLAKMKQLIHRGLVDGCGCGCRGDFRITDSGRSFIAGTEPEGKK